MEIREWETFAVLFKFWNVALAMELNRMDINDNEEEEPRQEAWQTPFFLKVVFYSFCIGVTVFAALATLASHRMSVKTDVQVIL